MPSSDGQPKVTVQAGSQEEPPPDLTLRPPTDLLPSHWPTQPEQTAGWRGLQVIPEGQTKRPAQPAMHLCLQHTWNDCHSLNPPLAFTPLCLCAFCSLCLELPCPASELIKIQCLLQATLTGCVPEGLSLIYS